MQVCAVLELVKSGKVQFYVSGIDTWPDECSVFVCLFILCGHGSGLLWTPNAETFYWSSAPAQGEEGNWCVQCMCMVCRVDEGTVGVSSFLDILSEPPLGVAYCLAKPGLALI